MSPRNARWPRGRRAIDWTPVARLADCARARGWDRRSVRFSDYRAKPRREGRLGQGRGSVYLAHAWSRTDQHVRLTVMAELRPRGFHIVFEYDEPPFVHRPLQNPPLGLERHQRLDVVPHDPRQRQMGRGRRQIRDEERALAVRLDQKTLMVGRVPRREDAMNAGDDLAIPIDELHLPARRQWFPVVREVARRRALIRVRRPLVQLGTT